jgi:hypothetical protein
VRAEDAYRRLQAYSAFVAEVSKQDGDEMSAQDYMDYMAIAPSKRIA